VKTTSGSTSALNPTLGAGSANRESPCSVVEAGIPGWVVKVPVPSGPTLVMSSAFGLVFDVATTTTSAGFVLISVTNL
jgi:hypothetical protein